MPTVFLTPDTDIASPKRLREGEGLVFNIIFFSYFSILLQFLQNH